MGRSVVVGVLLIVAVVAAHPVWPVGALAARSLGSQAAAFPSGGIGLSREAWEALHGPGEVGQSLATYEGGRYSVGFADDVVAFIELGWEDQGGIAPEQAEAAVEALLPRDARLVETFVLPATAAGPISLAVSRYESAGLPDRFVGSPRARTESILVLYQEMTVPGRFEPNVARASIAVGTER